MKLKEYIREIIRPGKQPDLKPIYQDLMNMGYSSREIYDAINEQVTENITKIAEDYINEKMDEAADEDYDPDSPEHERDIDETE